jgi:uncharacterized membrane protein YdjX (TVP38/TMEM64 family)
MNLGKNKLRYFITTVWLLFFSFCFYFYFFEGDFIKTQFESIFGASILVGYLIYLIASCLRGFTLIPITYFLFVGIFFLPPLPLYLLTMIGVLVSSACVYYFSEYLNFDEYFETNHKKQVERVKDVLSRHELPIVIGWSFMPFLPTDVMCYVCGALEIDVKKFLLGVFIGEGIACAIYIFLGKEILNFI